jgi:fucose permease
MITARIFGSRIIQRFSPRAMISISILIAGTGFLFFWLGTSVLFGLTGLFIVGLGIANLYPFIVTLALNAAQGETIQAGARNTLASGTAILALPLALGRLADTFGIRPAYGIVLILLISVFLIIEWGRRNSASSI